MDYIVTSLTKYSVSARITIGLKIIQTKVKSHLTTCLQYSLRNGMNYTHAIKRYKIELHV